jgi:hypothetical protein
MAIHNIWVMAAATLVLSALIYGAVLRQLAPRAERSLLAIACLLIVPMSAGSFHLVRQPLDLWIVRPLLGDGAAYFIARMLYAPVTEELAKLWPLLIPAFRNRVTRENGLRIGMALGLGFGLGEILFIADLVTRAPAPELPWHQYGGFLQERFMVCLLHAGFAAMSLRGMTRWRGGLAAGLAVAMLLHLATNLPIGLAGLGWLGGDRTTAMALLGVWVIVLFFASGVLLVRLIRRDAPDAAPFGRADCPRCRASYARPILLSMNFGWKRYERCPACRTWNMV